MVVDEGEEEAVVGDRAVAVPTNDMGSETAITTPPTIPTVQFQHPTERTKSPSACLE